MDLRTHFAVLLAGVKRVCNATAFASPFALCRLALRPSTNFPQRRRVRPSPSACALNAFLIKSRYLCLQSILGFIKRRSIDNPKYIRVVLHLALAINGTVPPPTNTVRVRFGVTSHASRSCLCSRAKKTTHNNEWVVFCILMVSLVFII